MWNDISYRNIDTDRGEKRFSHIYIRIERCWAEKNVGNGAGLLIKSLEDIRMNEMSAIVHSPSQKTSMRLGIKVYVLGSRLRKTKIMDELVACFSSKLSNTSNF